VWRWLGPPVVDAIYPSDPPGEEHRRPSGTTSSAPLCRQTLLPCHGSGTRSAMPTTKASDRLSASASRTGYCQRSCRRPPLRQAIRTSPTPQLVARSRSCEPHAARRVAHARGRAIGIDQPIRRCNGGSRAEASANERGKALDAIIHRLLDPSTRSTLRCAHQRPVTASRHTRVMAVLAEMPLSRALIPLGA
jgi:hypothetical protein